MMTTRREILAMLSFAMLAGTSTSCRAGSVTIEDMDLDEGNVTALLEQTSQYYVDAMGKLIAQRYKDEYRAIRWEDLETAMMENRVARVEYHFVAAGEARVRVYHAMGGEPMGIMARSIFEGPTRPGTPVTPETPEFPEDAWEWDSEAEPLISATPAERAAADAADDAFFAGFDEIDVRARTLPMTDSVLEPFPVEGWQGELDPELKALRNIEHDIATGVLPRGGRIDAKIGDIMCSSCKHAMRSMASSYDLEIRATQIYRTLPYPKQSALIQAGKARLVKNRLVDASTGRPLLANEALTSARAAQVRRSLSPRAMGRTFKNMSWQSRSFQLGSPGESAENRPRPHNPDAEEPLPPEC
jgi:hypothetical protein